MHGGVNPGDRRICPRFVEVEEVRKDSGIRDEGLFSPGAAELHEP